MEYFETLRNDVVGMPHPCLQYFLKCYVFNQKCWAFYDGDHVIVVLDGVAFDHRGTTPPPNLAKYLPIEMYGYDHIVSSFVELGEWDKAVLKVYFDRNLHIQPTTSVSGTSFHGQIISFTYDEMVEKFGEPHYTSSIFDKTTAEWNFKFDDGTIFAIYDWKEYENMPALFSRQMC